MGSYIVTVYSLVVFLLYISEYVDVCTQCVLVSMWMYVHRLMYTVCISE